MTGPKPERPTLSFPVKGPAVRNDYPDERRQPQPALPIVHQLAKMTRRSALRECLSQRRVVLVFELFVLEAVRLQVHGTRIDSTHPLMALTAWIFSDRVETSHNFR